jgi:hypothetical protein
MIPIGRSYSAGRTFDSPQDTWQLQGALASRCGPCSTTRPACLCTLEATKTPRSGGLPPHRLRLWGRRQAKALVFGGALIGVDPQREEQAWRGGLWQSAKNLVVG